MVKLISMLKEILEPSDKKSAEQPDATDMPELESEESVVQKKNWKQKDLKY